MSQPDWALELQKLLSQWSNLKLGGEESSLLEGAEAATSGTSSLYSVSTSATSGAISMPGTTAAAGSTVPATKMRMIEAQIESLVDFRSKLQLLQERFTKLLPIVQTSRKRLVTTILNEIKFKVHRVNDLIDQLEDTRSPERLIGKTPPRPQATHEIYKRISEVSIATVDETCVLATSPMSPMSPSHESVDEEKFLNASRLSDPIRMSPGRPVPEPARIDSYKIEKTLRATLQGELKYGVAKDTGIEVAIKLCRKSLIDKGVSVSGRRVLEDIRNESRVMCELNEPGHPNILKIIEFFETKDDFHLVLEFASRGELYDIVTQAKRLDEEVAKTLFIQIASGVQYIHRKGYCHLDLSLENILMDSSGLLRIADFGLARKSLPGGFLQDTEFPQKPGKVQYMAPEIYAGSSFVGEQADVWSLGVVLFIMLAGFPPFDTPGISDLRFSMIYGGKIIRLLQRWRLDRIISPLAVSLLSGMLSPPESRLTMEQILSHEWLSSG